MDQVSARMRAHEINRRDPFAEPAVATTVCALAGEHEEGPEADVWIVARSGREIEREAPPPAWAVGNSGPGFVSPRGH